MQDLHSFSDMDKTLVANLSSFSTDRRKLFLAVFGLLTAITAVASALFFRDKYMYGMLVLATPLALVVVSSPRIAIYQFIFCVFIHFIVSPGLTLVDLSALILITSAAIDTLVGAKVRREHRNAGQSYTLTKYYLAIMTAVGIAGIFAYDHSLSIRPFLRIGFILATFLSVIRLSHSVSIIQMLKFYFWAAVANSAIALIPFIISYGSIRAFGLTGRSLDELTMLALPIGLALFLGVSKKERTRYGVGILMVLGGLFATQSRAPIIFATFGAIFTFWSAQRFSSNNQLLRDKRLAINTRISKSIRGHIKSILLVAGALVLVTLLVAPEVFTAASLRFERLLTTHPGGTFRLRLTLWKFALMAFYDNPLIGIGPGNFKSIGTLYGALHMDGALYWIQGLSAHNLFLQYLAETGIIGGTAVLALFWKQFSMAKSRWIHVKSRSFNSNDFIVSLCLYSAGAILFMTTLLEAGWLWSQTGFIAAFFLAMVSVNSVQNSPATHSPK